MPPNRKGSLDLAEGIATLNIANFVTTAKYKPLTQPQENVQAVQEILQGKTNTAPAESYWDWPTDLDSSQEVVVERILEEERIRQLFSVKHIESNLISAAANAAKSVSLEDDTVIVAVPPTEADAYWYTPEEEHVEEDVVPVTSQCDDSIPEPATDAATLEPPQSYWDFPAFKVKELVTIALMEEERIRQMLTVDHMQELLMGQCAQNAEPAPLEAADDAYCVF
jgi:hypothetical protein